MTFKVDLVVEGVDTLSVDFDESAASAFDTVEWSSQAGVTLASLYTDGNLVADACTFSRQLAHSGAGQVVKVFDDFVNITEISRRVDVTRQTVRHWVEGTRGPGGFPNLDHCHGQSGDKGAMKVWRWADVNEWLSQVGLDDGVDYPSWPEVVEIDAHIQRLEEPVGSAWKQASVKDVKAEIGLILEAALRATPFLQGSLKSTNSLAPFTDIFLVSKSLKSADHRATTKESKYEVVNRPPVVLKGYK